MSKTTHHPEQELTDCPDCGRTIRRRPTDVLDKTEDVWCGNCNGWFTP